MIAEFNFLFLISAMSMCKLKIVTVKLFTKLSLVAAQGQKYEAFSEN